MPNHLHLLIKPKGQETLSTIMHSLKPNFTKAYKAHFGLTHSLSAWQRSFYDHVIRNEKDLYRHMDYVHYNPVKHGYVNRPEDWPYSSYRSWVERGVYPEQWGWSEPSSFQGIGDVGE